MKVASFVRPILGILPWCLLLIVGLRYCALRQTLHGQYPLRGDELQPSQVELSRTATSWEAQRRQWEAILQDSSQQVTQARARMEEEMSTHEPLRAQITKMQAAAIRQAQEADLNRDRTQQLRKSLDQMDEKLRILTAEQQALAQEKQDLVTRVKNRDAELQQSVEQGNLLRARVATMEQNHASLSNELAGARRNIEDAYRTIAAQRQQINSLQIPVDTTNAPPR